MTSSTYSESTWHDRDVRPRTRRSRPSTGQRSAVVTLAVAIAAVGVIGYLAYVGGTAPKLDPSVPKPPAISSRFVRGPTLDVKLELGTALPELPPKSAAVPR